jgi:hypothetical protein
MKLFLKPSHNFFLYFLLNVNILCKTVESVSNKNFEISSICERDAIHRFDIKIDGAVVTSNADNNLECVISFRTDTVLQRFMLHFEKLALDCDHHLYIYDGNYELSHAFVENKKHISCQSNKTEVGFIYTKSNFVTLKYMTNRNRSSYFDNGFSLIITSFKHQLRCKGHTCLNSLCISQHLLCDGINHCGDYSDETNHAFCEQSNQSSLTQELMSIDYEFIGILIVIILITALIVISLWIFLFYQRSDHLTSIEERSVYNEQNLALISRDSTLSKNYLFNFYGE